MKNLDYTLGECLSKCGLRCLPDALSDGERVHWINAIVLVSKGGIEEYCLATNKGDGKPSITQDFGVCRAISFIKSIHPIERLSDRDIIPTFKSDEEIIHFLSKSRYDRAEIEALIKEGNREEISRRIYELTIESEKRKTSERERVDKIKKFAESQPKKPRSNGRKKKV